MNVNEKNRMVINIFNIKIFDTIQKEQDYIQEYNPEKEDIWYFSIKNDMIKFDPFYLYNNLPKMSDKYLIQVKKDQLGVSIGINIHNNYESEISEEHLKQMYLKLRNLSHETKRKYVRSIPEKHELIYEKMFKTGVPVDQNHIHFKGGKNECTYSHILDKDATKVLAEYIGVPFGSTLTSTHYNSEFGTKTDLLAFDSSGLDVSSFHFLHDVIHITSLVGLRGSDLLDCLENCRLVKGRKVLYDNREGLDEPR